MCLSEWLLLNEDERAVSRVIIGDIIHIISNSIVIHLTLCPQKWRNWNRRCFFELKVIKRILIFLWSSTVLHKVAEFLCIFMKPGYLGGSKAMNLMIIWVNDPFFESLLQIDLVLIRYSAFRLDIDGYLVVRLIKRNLTLAIYQSLHAFGLQKPQIHH